MEVGLQRKVVRGLMLGVGALVLFMGGVALWVYLVHREDEALSPVVTQALAEPAPAAAPTAEEERGLAMLVGLHAPDGADPVAFGREWVASVATPLTEGQQRPSFAKVPGRDWAIISTERSYAHFTEGAEIFRQRVQAAGELRPRFEKLMKQGAFNDAKLPMDGLPTNLYVPWLRAHQLELGLAVIALQEGRVAEGFAGLRNLSEHVRVVMAGSRTLSGKRAAVAAQTRMAVVLSQLLNDQPKLARNHLNDLQSILHPTMNAQDFRPAQAHEIRTTLRALQKYSAAEGRNDIQADGLAGYFMRHLTLPNATLNMVAPAIEPAMKHAKSTFTDSLHMLRELNEAQDKVGDAADVSSLGELRNAGGRMLVAALWGPAAPNVKSRALDLDDLMTLVFAQAALQASEVPAEDRDQFLREKAVMLFPPGVVARVNYDPVKQHLTLPSRSSRLRAITVKLQEE